MTESLGEKLRQAREAKGLSLRDVADQTRIAHNYLEAIENDNYKTLPGGIFNKGFVRSFAKAVGIDEKEALADYTNLIASQVGSVPEESEKTRRPEVLTNDAQSSGVGRILLGLLILGLLMGGIYYGWQFAQQQMAANPQPAPSPSPQQQAAANNNQSQPSPSPNVSTTEGLKIQVKSISPKDPVSIEATPDGGKKLSFNLIPGETRDLSAQTSLRLQYSKYLANQIEMTINNRPANVKATSDDPRLRNSIIMEITKENAAQYLK